MTIALSQSVADDKGKHLIGIWGDVKSERSISVTLYLLELMHRAYVITPKNVIPENDVTVYPKIMPQE